MLFQRIQAKEYWIAQLFFERRTDLRQVNCRNTGASASGLLFFLWYNVLLTVIIRIATKIVELSPVVLNFIAIVTALGAVCIIIDGIMGPVAAFLLTPYGLPLLTIMLPGQVQRFKCRLQDCVY